MRERVQAAVSSSVIDLKLAMFQSIATAGSFVQMMAWRDVVVSLVDTLPLSDGGAGSAVVSALIVSALGSGLILLAYKSSTALTAIRSATAASATATSATGTQRRAAA